jgi:hypothetical protein
MLPVILVTGPILSVRTAAGTSRVGLHELLHLAYAGALIDLPGVRADQRAPVLKRRRCLCHHAR